MDKKSKVITVCGSLKYKIQIMEQAEKLALEGNCVLTMVYPIHEDMNFYTAEQINLLGQLHMHRIDMSDSIFVVNVDGYIGNSTEKEIEYAKKHKKEVLYLFPITNE